MGGFVIGVIGGAIFISKIIQLSLNSFYDGIEISLLHVFKILYWIKKIQKNKMIKFVINILLHI